LKYKCEFFNCNKELDPSKKEVRTIRIKKGIIKLKNGKTIIDWDGYRFICEFHDKLIFDKRLAPTLELIYGKRKQRFENKKARSKEALQTNRNKEGQKGI